MASSATFTADQVNQVDADADFRLSIASELNEEKMDDCTDNFVHWVRINAIREIVESFYLYIDELLMGVRLFEKQMEQRLTLNDYHEIIKALKEDKLPFKKKIEELKNSGIDLPSDYYQYFDFMEQIRHCASHNNGIVHPRHFSHRGKNNTARIEWLDLGLFVVSKDGKERKLKPGMIVEGPAGVYLKVKKTIKELPYGGYLKLSLNEASRMAFTMYIVLLELNKQAARHFQKYPATQPEPAEA